MLFGALANHLYLLLHPGMLLDGSDWQALAGVLVQQLANQINHHQFAAIRRVGRDDEGLQTGRLAADKGRALEGHGVQKDAEGPRFGLQPVVPARSGADLGRGKADGAVEPGKVAAVRQGNEGGAAKVDDADVVVLVDDDVLVLDVAMQDALAVHVEDGREDLAEDVEDERGGQVAVRFDALEQVAWGLAADGLWLRPEVARGLELRMRVVGEARVRQGPADAVQLGHKVDVVAVIEKVQELHNVRMVQALQEVHLAGDAELGRGVPEPCVLGDLCSADELYRHALGIGNALPTPDESKRALSDRGHQAVARGKDGM